MVPNVFPNVRSPYNVMTVTNETTPGAVTITLAEGFYTGVELATAINAALVLAGNTDVTIAFTNINTIQTQFEATNASVTDTYTITMNPGLGRLLGTDTVTLAPTDVTGLGQPNLSGVRLVHIKSEKLGHSMGLHSSDNITHDMCVSVPFDNTVVYGGVAIWAPQDTISSVLDMAFDVCLSNGVDISLWDEQMLPLTLPSNFELELQFKIVHSVTPV